MLADRQTDRHAHHNTPLRRTGGGSSNKRTIAVTVGVTGTDAWHATAVLFQQRSDAKLSRSVPIALHNITVVCDFCSWLQMIVKCGMNNCRSLCWPRILIPPTRMYSCNGSLLRECARVSVCLSVSISPERTSHPHQIFVHFLCMVVALSYSGGVAMRYVISFLR